MHKNKGQQGVFLTDLFSLLVIGLTVTQSVEQIR